MIFQLTNRKPQNIVFLRDDSFQKELFHEGQKSSRWKKIF